MNQFKRAKVVMLSTNEKANGIIVIDCFRTIKPNMFIIDKNNYKHEDYKAQHLYIISDDEIKEGDWVYSKSRYSVGKVEEIQIAKKYKNDHSMLYCEINNEEIWSKLVDCKKIIATTDSSLKIKVVDKNTCKPIDSNIMHKYKNIHLPQPSQQFVEKYIEEYNKGNIITEVMVEYINIMPQSNGLRTDGKIIDEIALNPILNTLCIPIINPKDNTITIKKLKAFWSREEVSQLLHNIVEKGNISSQHYLPTQVNKWIEENLN